MKNKQIILFASLLGIFSTVQAMERPLGQKVIQSCCFKDVLDHLTFKDQIKIQGLNKQSYKAMEKHIHSIPLTYKFTVNGDISSDQFLKDLTNMGDVLQRAQPKNIHIHFEKHVDVDIFDTLFGMNQDRQPERHVKSLRLTNVEFGSEGSRSGLKLPDAFAQLKELQLINCKYSAFDQEANQEKLQGLSQGESSFHATDEKVFLRIGNAPALEKVVVTEDPNEQRTMQVSVFGHCPNLQSVELDTKHAQETLEPFLQHPRRDILCEYGGTVHKKCVIHTNVID